MLGLVLGLILSALGTLAIVWASPDQAPDPVDGPWPVTVVVIATTNPEAH